MFFSLVACFYQNTISTSQITPFSPSRVSKWSRAHSSTHILDRAIWFGVFSAWKETKNSWWLSDIAHIRRKDSQPNQMHYHQIWEAKALHCCCYQQMAGRQHHTSRTFAIPCGRFCFGSAMRERPGARSIVAWHALHVIDLETWGLQHWKRDFLNSIFMASRPRNPCGAWYRSPTLTLG